MDDDMDEQPPVLTDRWEFDNWAPCNLGLRSTVEVFNTDGGMKLVATTGKGNTLEIDLVLDQWGTWHHFAIGDKAFGMAQESGTRSFFSALIAGLEKMKGLADHGEPVDPTHTNFEKEPEGEVAVPYGQRPVTEDWIKTVLPANDRCAPERPSALYKGLVADVSWIQWKTGFCVYVGAEGILWAAMTRKQFLNLLSGLGVDTKSEG